MRCPCLSLRSVLAFAALSAVVFVSGCEPRLAQQDSYFAPLAETDAAAAAEAALSRYGALQALARECAGSGDTALLCPPPRPSAAAYGAGSNAYRRWAEDSVRELPALSATGASSAGGG